MKVLFVESRSACFREPVRVLRHSGVQAEAAPDPGGALWSLAEGGIRVVVVDLRGGELQWEVIAAALWSRPPARVIALADSPVDAALRRRAYGAGVWELTALPRGPSRGLVSTLTHAVRRALGGDLSPAVLFVDECRDITSGLGALLSDQGYFVEPAGSVSEAVGLMSGRDYSLIVTEAGRRSPDGFAILKEAARLQPGVPSIVLTASLDDEILLRSIELGAKACVFKLSEPDDIVREIVAALRPDLAPGSSRI